MCIKRGCTHNIFYQAKFCGFFVFISLCSSINVLGQWYIRNIHLSVWSVFEKIEIKMMVKRIRMCFKLWELTNVWKKNITWWRVIYLGFRKLELRFYLLTGWFLASHTYFFSLKKWRVWTGWWKRNNNAGHLPFGLFVWSFLSVYFYFVLFCFI